MKITVLYNLSGTSTTTNISEADDDTGQSANDIYNVLITLGYEAEVLAISQKEIKSLGNLETDLVFNLIEWSGRETEDAVRAIKILEDRKIKFTGCGSETYRISSDKTLMKKVLVENNIPTPKFEIRNTKFETNFNFSNLEFPVIVKPAMEHCAIGITQDSVKHDSESLMIKVESLINEYQQPVIVEEFIDGPEAHVTVLEKDGKPWVLPPAVFEYKKKEGYVGVMSYEAKWNSDSWEGSMNDWKEDLNPNIEYRISKLAEETFVKLGGRTHSRVDMRIRGEDIFVLEINHNPGLGWDEDSGMTYSCKKAGITYQELISTMVKSAL